MAKFGFQADFEGQIHFLSPEEGGRRTQPIPGYRPGFHYNDHDFEVDWVFDIWPLEYFTDEGDVAEGQSVPLDCFARFWIVNRELRVSIHRQKLRPGVEFEIREGFRVVGTGVVTNILNLLNDDPPSID